eukprot:m.66975 g.66975  ORF g.66975 m.66975 type:complete len:382 (+) comp7649_c0_seq1:218-1363(+)
MEGGGGGGGAGGGGGGVRVHVLGQVNRCKDGGKTGCSKAKQSCDACRKVKQSCDKWGLMDFKGKQRLSACLERKVVWHKVAAQQRQILLRIDQRRALLLLELACNARLQRQRLRAHTVQLLLRVVRHAHLLRNKASALHVAPERLHAHVVVLLALQTRQRHNVVEVVHLAVPHAKASVWRRKQRRKLAHRLSKYRIHWQVRVRRKQVAAVRNNVVHRNVAQRQLPVARPRERHAHMLVVEAPAVVGVKIVAIWCNVHRILHVPRKVQRLDAHGPKHVESRRLVGRQHVEVKAARRAVQHSRVHAQAARVRNTARKHRKRVGSPVVPRCEPRRIGFAQRGNVLHSSIRDLIALRDGLAVARLLRVAAHKRIAAVLAKHRLGS